MKRIYPISVGLLIFWFVASSLSFYPHHLSYFNELIGKRINMYKHLADSNVDWGQSQYYLQKYIHDNPDKNIKVLPRRRSAGTVVVNVNALVGVTGKPEKYRWLRARYKPVGHIPIPGLSSTFPKIRAPGALWTNRPDILRLGPLPFCWQIPGVSASGMEGAAALASGNAGL